MREYCYGENNMNKKYTLAELLSQCSPTATAITPEQQAWLDMSPVGLEVINIDDEVSKE